MKERDTAGRLIVLVDASRVRDLTRKDMTYDDQVCSTTDCLSNPFRSHVNCFFSIEPFGTC